MTKVILRGKQECGSLLHRKLMKVLAMAVVAACPCFGFAKESKWIGPAMGGNFSDAANWDNGVPGPGDVAVFDKETATSNTGDSPDCGSLGLTIRNSAPVTLNMRIKGSGPFIKQGAGELTYKAYNYSYTGDLRVEEGKFVLTLTGATLSNESLVGKSTDIFGKGTITVTGSGIFRANGWSSTVNSKIVVTGHNGGVAIESNGQTSWSAAISGDCDFGIYNAYEVMTFGGTVTAPGKTVTMSAVNWNWKWCGWSAVFDCNLVLDTQNDTIQLQGKSLNPGNTLTVKSAKIEMNGSATWGGMVVVKSGGKIKSTGGANFSETTGITIEDGGTIEVVNNTSARRLTLGSTMQADGQYSKDNTRGKITNNGKITVNSGIKLWTGAGDKVWSNAANWDGAVAVTGDTVIFPFDTVFAAGETDIGADGMTFDCRGNVGGPLKLTGTGTLVKKGVGTYTTGAFNTVSGGLRIEAGVAKATMSGTGFNYGRDAFGSGTIEVTGSGSVYFNSYISTNTQPIVIHDHDGSVAAIQTSGSHANLGTITSDGDFTISSTWGTPIFLGKISAPGHIGSFPVPNWNTDYWPFNKTEFADVDASLAVDVNNKNTIRLTGSFERKTNDLTVLHGGVETPANQRWGTISLADKTTANVAKGVTFACDALTVAGVAKPNGVYRKAKLPGVLTGDGRLLVGDEPGLVMVFR